MCGIIGYLCKKNSSKIVFETLLNGLRMIENRGYDSAGICGIKNGEILTRKFASKDDLSALEQLKGFSEEFESCEIGLGHTRWATHGGKNDENSHPHLDLNNNFALVHNGIIENYQELKERLIKLGYLFKSETDTEVVVNLISYNYSLTGDIQRSFVDAISELKGSWSLGMISRLDGDKLYLSKNGNPLLLGFSEDSLMIASEMAGFCNMVDKYIVLSDNDVLWVNLDDLRLMDNEKYKRCKLEKYKICKLEKQMINLSPDPYPHWMIKEIEEQPESILRALNSGEIQDSIMRFVGLDVNKERFVNIKNLMILACGTSFYAGYYVSYWLKELGCFNTVSVMDASEFCLKDLPLEDPGIIVLSQSGETKDVHRAIEWVKKTNTPLISVVNVIDSLIAREADSAIYLNAGREVGVASTKSFTSQCIVLILVGIWFAQQKQLKKYGGMRDMRVLKMCDEIINEMKKLPLECQNIIDEHKKDSVKLASFLKNYEHCFIIGRGPLYPIALEASLKLKEIGYIHAEGFCGGSLKHGPFALIGKDSPVIILSDDESKIKMETAIEEIKSREAPVILISNHETKHKVDFHIHMKHNNLMTNLLYVIIFQLTSYELSIQNKNDPDHPKNLAKVVTVDG